jgi:adenylate cyclase
MVSGQIGKGDAGKRQLGAVLMADVVGYSRLMSTDEFATHQRVGRYLEVFEEIGKNFGGALVETRGDSALVLFESAVSAVECAVEVQARFERFNADISEDKQICFRIGINAGEILRDHRGVHGDSVNIAARLESIADPGSIFVSADVYNFIRTRLRFGYEFIGSRTLKNIAEPVDVYRVRTEVDGATMAPSVHRSRHHQDHQTPTVPSVVVLPFRSMGSDDTASWLADGITEDITVSLSKFKNLFVISRNSAFMYRDKQIEPRQAAQQLGVRYVTQGSIRQSGNRLRISVELADTIADRTIWGEQYNRDLDDIFSLQDEITETVVGACTVQIEASERERAQRALPRDMAAYSYVLQGQQHIFRYTRNDNQQARHLYRSALETDARYPRALASLSRTLNRDWRYSWAEDPEGLLDKALYLAQTAVELDPSDARGYGELGFVHLYRKEHEASINAYRRARSLNPNDADLLSDMADALAHYGRSEESIELLERATRLNPFYPDQYLWHLGGAYYNLKRYEDVITTVQKMHNPIEGRRLLAASYAQLGRMTEAHEEARLLLEAHPNFSLEHWSKILPDRLEDETSHYVEGLRKAGLR